FEEKYIYDTNPFAADSDQDGFPDGTEVATGYNPNGSGRITYYKFSYGKPRVNSLSIEKSYATNLAIELKKRLGREIGVAAKDWKTIVNAYIYGGYTISEIVDTLNYGPGLVHPTIPAYIWRNSIQYNKAHH
ncbi:MAG: thrombospondin type 3 repeat-containing protein, partial [Candidatus Parcubacteria bacterium]|nr:thrombospondin type 3 repeat-containing protein [Candidatus Parcubacteria bacterium]